MSFLFGGKSSTNADNTPKFTSLRLQTSAYGKPIPLVYGTTRIAPNLIWYGDLKAVKHEQKQSGGKGGGSVTSTNYTYTVSFLMALCETLAGFYSGYAWVGKVKKTLTDVFHPVWGTWDYLATYHPDQALEYKHTYCIAEDNYDLGISDNLPNVSAEVYGFCMIDYPSAVDASPDEVISDLLFGDIHGAISPGTNAYFSLDLSSGVYRSYALATGLVISPAYTEQRPVGEMIQEIADLTNSAVVFNGAAMTLVPYGDRDITANGVTYTAPTPLYNLDDDDFLAEGDELPVRVQRKRPSDAWNVVKMEYLDRAYDYNAVPVEARDSSGIEMYGERAEAVVSAHMFALGSAAQTSVQLRLRRNQILNTYQFRLSQKYLRLDPMDVVTLTHAPLGLNLAWVRIKEIQENEDYSLTITAEDFRLGSGSVTVIPGETPAGPTPADPDPGDVNDPILFEPDSALTGNRRQIWGAASGGADWGGCEIWLSSDDESYSYYDTLWGGSKTGRLSGTFPSGSDPDTANTCPVDLSESESSLVGVTQDDADKHVSLAYVDGELIAYTTADLTSQYNYDLTDYIRRGLYGTTIGAHLSGSAFAIIDKYVAKIPYAEQWVGQTIYVKLLSFNIYGRRTQTLDEVDPYTIVPGGGSYVAIGDVYAPSTAPTVSGIPQWDANQVLTVGLEVVDSIGTPGLDTNIPTEKAVRDAIVFSEGGITPVEVADIDDPSSELNTMGSPEESSLVLAYEATDDELNACTLYLWDADPTGTEDVPYRVDGASSGMWLAVAGKYMATDCNLPTGKNFKINGVPLDISGILPDGDVTGDLIRWNSVLEGWEVKSEPFAFAGLVLTPATESLIEAEGAIYYDSDDKCIKVCTEV